MSAVVAWISSTGLLLLAGYLSVLGFLHSRTQDGKISEQGNVTTATGLMERMEAMLARQDTEIRDLKTENREHQLNLQQLRSELAARDERDRLRDRRERIRDTFIQQLQGDLSDAGLPQRPYPPELITS